MQDADALVDGGEDAVGFRGEGGTVDAHGLVANGTLALQLVRAEGLEPPRALPTRT